MIVVLKHIYEVASVLILWFMMKMALVVKVVEGFFKSLWCVCVCVGGCMHVCGGGVWVWGVGVCGGVVCVCVCILRLKRKRLNSFRVKFLQ